MAKSIDEFLKNASPEVRAVVEKSGQTIDKHRQELQNEGNPGEGKASFREGDRSGTDGLVKNMSPEAQAAVVKSGQVIDHHHQELKSESNPGFKDVSERSETPARNGPSRPDAGAPEPSHGPSNQQSERRIDQAMDQKAQAQAAEQGKEATKSGASIEESKAPTPPAKEPER